MERNIVGEQSHCSMQSLKAECLRCTEDVLGNPPTWAWRLHVQEVKWLSEEALSRAALTTYATNGFTVRSADGSTHLEAIKATASRNRSRCGPLGDCDAT